MHFVIKHKAFETRPQKRRGHAGTFIDQIAPGKGRRQRCRGFLGPILRVKRLGIGHRGRHARGQAKPIGQLRRGRIHQCGLAAAPRKRAAAQVDDKGPIGKHHRMPRLDQIDHYQAGQGLRQRLRQKSGKRRGRGRPGLGRGDTGDRDVMVQAGKNHIHRILAKPHRRNHRADMRLDKGARGKRARPPGRDIKHLDNRGHMFGERKGRCHRFCGVADQRIGGVHIQIEIIRYIGGDTASGEPGDIGQIVLKPGKIMEIGQGRGPVQPAFQIQGLHRRAAGPEIDPVIAHGDRAGGIAAMQGKGFGRARHGTRDQIRRQGHPPIGVLGRAMLHKNRRQPIRHLAHAQFRQKPQRRAIDGLQVIIG